MTESAAAFNHAKRLHQQGALEAAARLYRELLTVRPQDFAARHMLGVLLAQQGRAADALREIGAALAIRPDDAPALTHHGNVLLMLERPEDALESYRRALAAAPGDIEALYQSGNVQAALGRTDAALDSYARLLALAPQHAGALNNRGAAEWELGQADNALASYGKALAAAPDFVPALNNMGHALVTLRRFEDALACHDRSLAVAPDQNAVAVSRAGLLLRLKRPAQALEAYRQILARDPADRYALGGALTASLQLCDWNETDRLMPLVRDGLKNGTAVIPPFMLLGASGDKALQRAAAERAFADSVPPPHGPLWTSERYDHDRIRIAYLSSDYGQAPVPALIAVLIEQHDRARFEVIGVSTGLDDGSKTRTRIVRAFDRFQDMQGRNANAIAQWLRASEIDILVELNGHTDGDHFAVLAQRPCPVQVNYLGYPGTDGAAALDYILADPVVAPFADRDFFREQIVHLPDCYFPSSYGAIPPAPARVDAGLPATGFVFCNFNNSWKFTRAMFDAWMRLLGAVPGSVLWLLEAHPELPERLARAAAARSVDPARLIYAKRTTPQEHLARLGLADLMLDTSPYNGHMTSSDALWAGVPLVTARGQAFAGRVAASLLGAMNTPELVTQDLESYEALALSLARDPARLDALREKLARNRDSTALFDIPRLCRHVEQAYQTMHAISRKGEAPRSFAVA